MEGRLQKGRHGEKRSINLAPLTQGSGVSLCVPQRRPVYPLHSPLSAQRVGERTGGTDRGGERAAEGRRAEVLLRAIVSDRL